MKENQQPLINSGLREAMEPTIKSIEYPANDKPLKNDQMKTGLSYED